MSKPKQNRAFYFIGKTFIGNKPFVLQLNLCPNIVAIQKHTLVFCGQEFA